jgi:hypothetical protein
LGDGKSQYFTTPSQLEANEVGELHFGVGQAQASVVGEVMGDAKLGVPGVTVTVQGESRRLNSTTMSEGRFSIQRLAEGRYEAFIDGDSLPAGYLIEAPARVPVIATAAVPGRVTLRVRAIRNVGGRVLMYDRALGRHVPVMGAEVSITELGLKVVSDREGRYLFRELPAGVFTVSASNQDKSLNKIVTLGESPVQQLDIDFTLAQK